MVAQSLVHQGLGVQEFLLFEFHPLSQVILLPSPSELRFLHARNNLVEENPKAFDDV
jgi:hypothetical protein